MNDRRVLLVAHTGRSEATSTAGQAARQLAEAGLHVSVLEAEAAEVCAVAGTELATVPDAPGAAEGCELVVVFGGDGTLLRGAELARPSETPVLGVNLGHVGFLAEAEREDVDATVRRVVDRDYDVEERMTIDVAVGIDGHVIARDWALNEASIEKASRERMLDVVLAIDNRPLSRWGCDGIVAATPTGSTAYAFSSGGPVVWPEVDALLVVPISAHALFARPLVVAPTSVVAIEVLAEGTERGVLWCDGRRKIELPPGARIEVRRGSRPVRLARLHEAPFTDRVVRKFQLPVSGWRGHPHVEGPTPGG